jgi:hypothetical protein
MLPSPLDRSTAERRCDESSERRQTTAGSTHRSGRDTSRAEGELVVRSRLRSVSETVGLHRRQTRRNECSLSLRQLRHSIHMSALSDFLTHATAPWWGAPAGAIRGRGLGGWISFASTKHFAQTAQQAQDLRDARDRVCEISVRSINEANADPGVHALARDPHRRGDVRLGPARLIPAHDQQAAMKRRTGITVGHENLRTGDGP